MTANLVEGRINKAIELDLDNGLKPVESHPDGCTDDGRFGKRRVDNPVGSIFGLEAVCYAEDASQAANILTDNEHLPVLCHRPV
jgi:hypothetical protein